MPRYEAEPGQQDPHGEMTGAISINMMMSYLPVTIWCVFIGPLVFERLWPTLTIGLVMGVVLPLIFMRPSRWVWAHVSAWMR